MTSAIIDVRDLRLTYTTAQRAVPVLHGVDLVIDTGQSVGLVGPSGSGKSSLMMIFAGLERPTSGTMMVAGEDLINRSEEELTAFRRENLGIVFQNFHLIPTMTARENVAVPADLAGADDPLGMADEALARVRLAARGDHYPGELSGGEQQRVALARALMMKPRLIMADEPTGNLDGETGQAMADLLFALCADSGTSLLLITHDRRLAAQCSRVVRLRDGRIEPEA